MRVRFRLEAASDVTAARDWYNERRAGLGDDLVAALENVLELISEFPDAFPEIAGGLRRAMLRRFPYALYYRIDRDVVDVVAVLHNSRSPASRQAR